jgi:dTDP-4-dehydrorhamnose reductase
MKVLVFGKTGQVASALQDLTGVTALGRNDADLSDPEACIKQIERTTCDVIINAAAYTGVDLAEREEKLAWQINALTPAAMARAAAKRKLPFIHLSTDYVFDGAGDQSFAPDAPTGPLNAYGRSKAAGEQGVRAAGGAHVILRTSWVFSATGNNFVKSMVKLSQTRDTLDLVADQVGGPTPADDIAAACLALANAFYEGRGISGTYHFSGAPDVSWADFAREIFKQAGREITVREIPTSDWPTPAKRPLNSRLDCQSLFTDYAINRPDWRMGLGRVLKTLKVEKT